MIRALLLSLATMLAALLPARAASPDLHLLLTHDTVNQRLDGVTESFHYQERMTRIGDAVWLERVLPPGYSPDRQPSTAGDHGPNLQILPRWIRKADDGNATLTLVNRADRYVVAVKPIEFGRLGFGGNWIAESNLIDPVTVNGMKPMARASSEAGARWYEATHKGRYSRVLWSEKLQFPLAIETGSENGRSTSRTVAQLKELPKAMPWAGLEGYAEREIDDFGD